MDIDQFVQQRRENWQQLEGLVEKATTKPRTLTAANLNEMGRLYRIVTSDLALVQRELANRPIAAYLNQLVGRSHVAIYRSEPIRWRTVKRFFTQTFPQLYREVLPYTITAFLLFFLAAFVTFAIVWQQPQAIYTIEGPGVAGLVREVEAGKLWTDISPSARSAASSMILTNNIQVMFLTWTGGMTAGLLTLWVIVSNGLHLGAIFGLLQVHGLSPGLAEFIVAHGFIELSVIFLAGGCGFYMGDALLRPGLLNRREALTERARICVQLILGSAPLLVIAGLIEGFVSPSSLHWSLKLLTGVLTGGLLHGYWLRWGKVTVQPLVQRSVYKQVDLETTRNVVRRT